MMKIFLKIFVFEHSSFCLKIPRQGKRGQKDIMSKILSPQSLRDSPP